MSTFTLPESQTRVNSIPDLAKEDLLSFPAFKVWISTLQHSLKRQEISSHEFHGDPYILRKIDVQSIDRFGGGRLGFVKLKADVSNSQGESLPGSVFLRGGSVGMLVSGFDSSPHDQQNPNPVFDITYYLFPVSSTEALLFSITYVMTDGAFSIFPFLYFVLFYEQLADCIS